MHFTLSSQNEDLADAVEDTRRRAGMHPVPKLKVRSANPDSTKRVKIFSLIPLIMKAMPENERIKLWYLATLPTAPLRSLQTDRRDRNPRPAHSNVSLSFTLSYDLLS